MIVLDTNVLSELLRPAPNRTVVAWLDAQPRSQLFTTAITRAELLYGARLLPDGQRRRKLLKIVGAIFDEDLADRVLGFESAAGDLYAEIGAARSRAGRPISQFDCMIAAVARLHGARLATRNVRDFEGCDVELVNPWASR